MGKKMCCQEQAPVLCGSKSSITFLDLFFTPYCIPGQSISVEFVNKKVPCKDH